MKIDGHLNGPRPISPNPSSVSGLSSEDKHRLCQWYKAAGANTAGEPATDAAIQEQLENDFDKILVQRNSQGQISTALACRQQGNPNGTEIGLVLGEPGKAAEQERLTFLKHYLNHPAEPFYVEADGAVASALLKDDTIKMSLVSGAADTGHSASRYDPHDQRLVFGHYQSAPAIPLNMRSFYHGLLSYKKTKAAIDEVKKPSTEDNNQHIDRLIDVFDEVVASTMPLQYKAILLGKISRKAASLEGDAEHKKALSGQGSAIVDLLNSASSEDVTSVALHSVSGQQKNDLKALFEEKRAQQQQSREAIANLRQLVQFQY